MAPTPVTADRRSTQPAARRVALGLRWKMLLLVLAVLGIAHAAFAWFSYHALIEQHERSVQRTLDAQPVMLSTVLQQASQGLAALGIQIASSLSPDQLDAAAASGELPVPQALSELTRIDYFDANGRRLASWQNDPARQADVAAYAPSVLKVARDHQPETRLLCQQECELFAIVPTFGAEGDEIVVAIAAPVASALREFNRLSGVDIALIGSATQSGGMQLWGRPLLALTNAPELREPLARLHPQSLPPDGAIVRLHEAHLSLRAQRTAMPLAAGRVEAVYLYDETAALARIAGQARKDIVLNLLVLLLSGLAVFALLSRAMRRLRGITAVFPQIGTGDYAGSREALRALPQAHWPDEIDVLHGAAGTLVERLEALHGAEAASKAKSLFLATMSHEIRTPMNAVMGLLEIVEDGPLDSEQRRSIHVARESAQALLRVIDDVLDFSKIEASRLELEHVAFSLRDVVEGVGMVLAPAAFARSLRLIVHVDPQLPARVIGDPLRLRQILLNLGSNAIKFTAAGRVTILAEMTADGSVQLTVRDTGIGMSAVELRRLFQPFTQADSSTMRRFGGTGLGLSIVDGLVKLMQGRIEVDSVPQRGTEIRVVLRLAADAAAPPPPLLVQNRRVQVALEDPEEARYVTHSLLTLGAEIVAAPGAEVCTLHDVAQGVALSTPDGHRVVLRRPLRLAELASALGRDPEPETVPAKTRVAPLPQRPRVLVAEDHPVNQQVIANQLAHLGCDAEIVDDGSVALERLAAAPFDVLLADLHMPNLDGLGLARQVRRLERYGRRSGYLPIVALTAAALDEDRAACRAAGMDDFLPKPASRAELVAVLQRVLPAPEVSASAESDAVTAAAHPPADCATLTLDAAVLRESSMDDPQLARRLLDEFLRINGPLVSQLPQRASVDALTELGRNAHRLLGSARTIGAAAFATALAALEAAAQRGEVPAADEHLSTVRARYEELAATISGEKTAVQ